MLVAVDQTGKKRIPYIEPNDDLRILSDNQQLNCPECHTIVILAAGPRRTHHFRHKSSVECIYESEPETVEHIEGKLLIYTWLKETYPEARIELEYKIRETNQRADVIAMFSNGDKWAFEMQCSRITSGVWRARSELYQQVGIKDFWILGKSLHKNGFTKGQQDAMKHRLVDLPLTIFRRRRWLSFLDTKTREITGFYWFKDNNWHSPTTLYTDESTFPLNELKRYEEFWADKDIYHQYLIWKEARKKKSVKLWKERRQKKDEQTIREAEILLQKEQKLKAAVAYQQELREFKIELVKKDMTNGEAALFEKLVKKHSLKDRNFPGICKIHVPHMELIKTPYPLWQLWLYDQYIYPFGQGKTKVWVPEAAKQMKDLFRTMKGDINVHFSFAAYRYFETLSETGMLTQLSKSNSKYYEILSNELPQMDSLKMQSYIAYRLSTHSGIFQEGNEKFNVDIENAWNLYIQQFRSLKHRSSSNSKVEIYNVYPSFKERGQLQYMMNLFGANPEILTHLEGVNLLNIHHQTNNKMSLTASQAEQYLWIKGKIERFYEISLDSQY